MLRSRRREGALCTCHPKTPLPAARAAASRFDAPGASAAAAAQCPDLKKWCGGAKPAMRAQRLAGLAGAVVSPRLIRASQPAQGALTRLTAPPAARPPSPPRPRRGPDRAGTLSAAAGRLDYVSGLGASAIWVSPVVQQCPGVFFGATGYHGYWAQGGGASAHHALRGRRRAERYGVRARSALRGGGAAAQASQRAREAGRGRVCAPFCGFNPCVRATSLCAHRPLLD